MTIERGLIAKVNEQLEKMANFYQSDFLLRGITNNAWFPSTVATGTLVAGATDAKHPGTSIYNSHASNANSGFSHLTDIYGLIIAGGEKTTIIFKTSSVSIGVLRRLGFHNATSAAIPSDGIYLKQDGVSGNELTGHCANNGTSSTTGTKYTLSANTWYRASIEVNADATLVTFKLYADDTDTLLWSDTLNTNIPGAGRFVGHGDTCTLTSPSSVTPLGAIDYMDLYLPNKRRVV